jgi:hypothetical protein
MTEENFLDRYVLAVEQRAYRDALEQGVVVSCACNLGVVEWRGLIKAKEYMPALLGDLAKIGIALDSNIEKELVYFVNNTDLINWLDLDKQTPKQIFRSHGVYGLGFIALTRYLAETQKTLPQMIQQPLSDGFLRKFLPRRLQL